MTERFLFLESQLNSFRCLQYLIFSFVHITWYLHRKMWLEWCPYLRCIVCCIKCSGKLICCCNCTKNSLWLTRGWSFPCRWETSRSLSFHLFSHTSEFYCTFFHDNLSMHNCSLCSECHCQKYLYLPNTLETEAVDILFDMLEWKRRSSPAKTKCRTCISSKLASPQQSLEVQKWTCICVRAIQEWFLRNCRVFFARCWPSLLLGVLHATVK